MEVGGGVLRSRPLWVFGGWVCVSETVFCSPGKNGKRGLEPRGWGKHVRGRAATVTSRPGITWATGLGERVVEGKSIDLGGRGIMKTEITWGKGDRKSIVYEKSVEVGRRRIMKQNSKHSSTCQIQKHITHHNMSCRANYSVP